MATKIRTLQAEQAKVAYDAAEYDPLLLMIDNNQKALESALQEIECGGNLITSMILNLHMWPFTTTEKLEIRKWLSEIVNKLSFVDYVAYWSGVDAYYKQKLQEQQACG